MNWVRYALLTSMLFAALLSARGTFAQSRGSEPAAIAEVGGAASQSVTGGGASFGPDFAVEITPIENWLEIEAGVTPLFKRGSTEWDADLLFKKPFTLSEKVEFMAGAGPEWIHSSQHGLATNAAGVEVAADFMFWPSIGKHKLGWFLEPAYDYSFGRGHEQSLGISGGLLIGIGSRHARAHAAPKKHG